MLYTIKMSRKHTNEELDKYLTGVESAKKAAGQLAEEEKRPQKKKKQVPLIKVTGPSKSNLEEAVSRHLNRDHFSVEIGASPPKPYDPDKFDDTFDKLQYGAPVSGDVQSGRDLTYERFNMTKKGIYKVAFVTEMKVTDIDDIKIEKANTTDTFWGYSYDYTPVAIQMGIGQISKQINVEEGEDALFELIATKVVPITHYEELPQPNLSGIFYPNSNRGWGTELPQAEFTTIARNHTAQSFFKIAITNQPPNPKEFNEIVRKKLDPNAYNSAEAFNANCMTVDDIDDWNMLQNADLVDPNYNPPRQSYAARPLIGGAEIVKQTRSYINQCSAKADNGGGDPRKFENHHTYFSLDEQITVAPEGSEYHDHTSNGAHTGIFLFRKLVGVVSVLCRKPGFPARDINGKWPGNLNPALFNRDPDYEDLLSYWYHQRPVQNPIYIIEFLIQASSISPTDLTLLSGQEQQTGFTYSDDYASTASGWNLNPRPDQLDIIEKHESHNELPSLKPCMKKIVYNVKSKNVKLSPGLIQDTKLTGLQKAHKHSVYEYAREAADKKLPLTQRYNSAKKVKEIDVHTMFFKDHSVEELVYPHKRHARWHKKELDDLLKDTRLHCEHASKSFEATEKRITEIVKELVLYNALDQEERVHRDMS